MNLETLRHTYLRRVVTPVLGAVGPSLTERLARRLGRGVFDMNTDGRRKAEHRIHAALGPNVTDKQITAIVEEMYDHIARFWSEAVFLRRRLSDASWRKYVQVDGEDQLRQLANARRGCLLATAYFGNPAACAIALGHLFRPLHVLVDYLAQPALQAWQKELYDWPNLKPIDVRHAARSVPQLLADGGAVMMICEHDRPRGRAIETQFLGRALRCYPTLDRLAQWFDVPVTAVTCRRGEEPFSFTLEALETLEPPTATDVDGQVTRKTLAVLERAILRHPEQYLWSTAARQDPKPADCAITPTDCNPSGSR